MTERLTPRKLKAFLGREIWDLGLVRHDARPD